MCGTHDLEVEESIAHARAFLARFSSSGHT
jgi:hypothetical protein